LTAQDTQSTNMPIDYSKWKDIEVSDDEDDTHPNIDTPSLFKWRHEARIQRMEELEQKKKDAENLKKKAVEDLKILKEKANSRTTVENWSPSRSPSRRSRTWPRRPRKRRRRLTKRSG